MDLISIEYQPRGGVMGRKGKMKEVKGRKWKGRGVVPHPKQKFGCAPG